MATQQFNWEEIERLYVTGTMRLQDLSAEAAPDAESASQRPSYSWLRRVSAAQDWKQKRKDWRAEQADQKTREKLQAILESSGVLSDVPSEEQRPEQIPIAPTTRISAPAQISDRLPALRPGGHYAEFLPALVLQRYEDAMRDEEYLSLRRDIAVARARLAEIAQRLITGESAAAWRSLKKQLRIMNQSRAKGKNDEAAAALTEIYRLIEYGAGEEAAWDEILSLQSHCVRLTESERKRYQEMQAFYTAEEMLRFASTLLNSVKTKVSDPDVLAAIADDFERATANAHA